MHSIDDLLSRFHEAGAQRLLLVSGKRAVLTVSGDLQTLDGLPFERDRLEGMILQMGGEATPGQAQFEYAAPTGRVRVTARLTERLAQIIVVPAGADAAVPTPTEEAHAAEDAHAAEEAGSPARGGNGFEAPATDDTTDDARDDDGDRPPLAREGVVEPEGTELDAGGDEDAAVREAVEGFETSLAIPVDTPDPSEAPLRAGWPESDAGGASQTDPVASAPDNGAPEPEPGGEGARSRPEAAPPALELRPDAPAMERLFLKMIEHGCSDLHVSADNAPLFRKDGSIVDLGGEPRLAARQTEALIMGITPDRHRKDFETRNDVDFAYEIPGVARFRCNLFRDRKGIGGVFRQIPADIMSAEELGLSSKLLELCQLKKGLVLVTGPTGSGKSTTLAALVDHINRTREDHIITIEDPIEFVHENRKCLINQREIGEHTASFKVALRAALREDPDIVLVGELRDLETVEIALETAETGHLVFGTLHTNTAAGTVSRLIDQFPSGQQAQIRTMLADTLKAVIAQTLCRRIGGGRVAALEVLIVTNAVANLIREDKAYQISSAMQTGRAQGMNTLNDALLDLIQRKVVEVEEAHRHAVDKPEFRNVLSRNGIQLEGDA